MEVQRLALLAVLLLVGVFSVQAVSPLGKLRRDINGIEVANTLRELEAIPDEEAPRDDVGALLEEGEDQETEDLTDALAKEVHALGEGAEDESEQNKRPTKVTKAAKSKKKATPIKKKSTKKKSVAKKKGKSKKKNVGKKKGKKKSGPKKKGKGKKKKSRPKKKGQKKNKNKGKKHKKSKKRKKRKKAQKKGKSGANKDLTKLQRAAAKLAKKTIQHARNQAKKIVGNAKNPGSSCHPPCPQAPDPKKLKKQANKYMKIDMPKSQERQVSATRLGLHDKLSIDPKVLHHADQVDKSLEGEHRKFLAEHAKNCKGPVCPKFGVSGTVNADLK